MKLFNDRELREFLTNYEVSRPAPELVARTKRLMHDEIFKAAVAPVKQVNWIFLFVGLAVAMSLCLFYMFTVGTVLRFVLPSYLLDFLRHTLYALTAAGSSLLGCALMILCLKQFCLHHAEERLNNL